MDETSGNSKMSGTAGSLLLAIGIISYFSGTLGAPRMFVFVGAALLILSIAAYSVEELSTRT